MRKFAPVTSAAISVFMLARSGMTLARIQRGAKKQACSREGSDMNDSERQESGHLMLITPERVFLRRPARPSAPALPGCVSCLCVDRGGPLADHRGWPRKLRRTGRHAAQCAPYHRQRLSLGDLPRDRAGKRSRRRLRSDWRRGSREPMRPYFVQRIRAAYAELRRRQRGDDISNAAFDTMCFGEALPSRCARSARRQVDRADRPVLRRAGDGGKLCRGGRACPRRASCICSSRRPASRSGRSGPGSGRGICCISPTRTSTSRIWRRTSAIPTSTHFSHSIRRFYGLKPRAIFSGSRDLAIYRSDPGVPDSAGFRQGRA